MHIKENFKFINILLSLIILGLIIHSLDLSKWHKLIKCISIKWLIVAAILSFIQILFRAIRWWIILLTKGVKLSTTTVFLLTTVGSALNLIIPAGGGELAKSYYGYRLFGLKEEMLSSVVVDKLLGLFSIFLLGSFTAFLYNWQNLLIFSLISSIIFGLFLFYPALLPWKLLTKLVKSLNPDKLTYFSSLSLPVKAWTLLLSIIAWIINFFQLYIITKALLLNVPINFVYTVGPLITLGKVAPFTIDGLGVVEGISIYLFNLIKINPEASFWIMLLYRGVNLLPSLLGILVMIFMKEEVPSVWKYEIKGDIFEKKLFPDGRVILTKNGQELSLYQWNKELNRIYPMKLLEKHQNFLVRLKEKQRRKKFLKFALSSFSKEEIPTLTVADIGCEAGYLTYTLSSKVKSIIGVDIDYSLLMEAKNSKPSNVSLIQADALQLPFPDNSFHLVIAAELLEHIPDPRAALKELLRIVKPKGVVVVSVPNEPLVLFIKKLVSFLRFKSILGTLNPQLALGHLHIFTKEKLKETVAGLGIIDRCLYLLPFFLNIFAQIKPLSSKNEKH